MNNPFQNLDKKLFPVQNKKSVRQKKDQVIPQPLSDEEQDDARLFMQAMAHVKTNLKQKDASPHFQLKEQIQKENIQITPRKKHGAEKSAQLENIKSTAEVKEEKTEDVFFEAMREVTPLSGQGRSFAPMPEQNKQKPVIEDIMAAFMEGKLEFALSNTDEYCEGYVVGLDEMTMNKLRSGALSPEAHLDLHGLNTVQAFEAMRNFLRGSWYKALRTVLIIPGRGHNSPNGIGILRSKVQDWLTQEPFKRVVLAFCTAQQLDGGLGGLYVLLRKYKKKGRIYWERTPNDTDLNDLL